MNNLNDAIDAVLDILQSAGVPNAYSTLPLMDTGALLKAQFTTTDEAGQPYLAGCVVSWRGATPGEEESLGEWSCNLAIEIWRGWNGDAGQRQMHAWIQSIFPMLWNYATLGGAVQNVAECKLVNNEPRISFEVLCHYARIDLTAYLVF